MKASSRRMRSVVGFLGIVAVTLACWFWLVPALVARQATAQKASGGGRRGASPSGGGGGGPILTVRAVPVVEKPFSLWATVAGTIAPLQLVTIRSQVTGILKAVHFQEGQMVENGQLLAEIEPEQFIVAVQTAIGRQNRDRALLENAKKDLIRYESLLAQDSISKQQVDTQYSLVKQLEATITADQSDVDAAQLQLNFTKIHAPLAGRIGLRQVDVGNLIRSGDANGLVSVAQVNPISLVFSLPQEQLTAELRAFSAGKQAEEIPVEILASDQKSILARGKLLTTDNQIDVSSGTLKMRALFDNAAASLLPNQFATVRLRVAQIPSALCVPNAAIQQTTKGTGVYVVDEQQQAKFQLVKVGAAQDDESMISEGLKNGDRVITEGFERVKDGAKVALADEKPAEKSPSGSPATREKRRPARAQSPS